MTFGGLRVPFGAKKPIVSLADFRGTTFAARPSEATWATVRALGATPTAANGDELSASVQRDEIAGMESTLELGPQPLASAFPTANAVLYFKANALIVLAPPAGTGARSGPSKAKRRRFNSGSPSPLTADTATRWRPS